MRKEGAGAGFSLPNKQGIQVVVRDGWLVIEATSPLTIRVLDEKTICVKPGWAPGKTSDGGKR